MLPVQGAVDLVVRIRACHARCPGSNPGRRTIFPIPPFGWLVGLRRGAWIWRWRRLVRRQLVRLFDLAWGWALRGEGWLARRYVGLAWRIVVRTRVRLPRRLKWRFCRRCGALFLPGKNCRVRLRRVGRRSSLVVTCLECGYRRKMVWVRRRGGHMERGRQGVGSGGGGYGG